MQRYSRSQIENLIEEWVIGRNSHRNKQIIRDGILEGLSLKNMSDKYGLSETRIKTVIRTFQRTVGMKE